MMKGTYVSPEQREAMSEGIRKAYAEGMKPPTYIDGRSNHPEYLRWINMMTRCFDPSNPGFHNYGGRGISVCAEWQNDPFVFFGYLETLGPCPEGYSIDRIDNDGDYEPGNIRWASRVEQSANSRRYLK